MEHRGEVGHVYPRFGLFGDSVHVGARYVHGLRRTYHRLKNRVGRTGCNCYVTWAMWNLVSVYFQGVLIWTQDWCKVCAERAIGSVIILDAPDGTPR
jgi:hypothetical protein